MKRTRKVYMPLWIAWLMLLFVVPGWGYLTYRTFFAGEERELSGWVMLTIMSVVISAVMLLMGYRKLPTHVIEEEEHK